MEVHSHSHTERKKWTHYLWEFLMLFLAVFCGFLAENLREHQVEHKREKKYAMQLLEDLKKDTTAYSRVAYYLKQTYNFYDSARLVFQQRPAMNDNEFVRLTRRLYQAFTLVTISTTFNQMKNSGSLRYIKNDSLSAGLSYYYDQLVPWLLKFFDYVNEKLHTQIQIEPFFAEHFDLNVTRFYFAFDSLELPNDLRYYGRSENADLLIRNYFQLYYNGVFFIINVPIKKANEEPIELIKSLKKEYHLQ